jgi:hypothetical protein
VSRSARSTGKTWRAYKAGLEEALYKPVVSFFENQGYLTSGPKSHRIVLAYDQTNDAITAVEVKPDDARAAISQALFYKDFADFVYIAVPSHGNLRTKIIEQLGLGLLTIGNAGRVTQKLAPKRNRPTDVPLRTRLVNSIIHYKNAASQMPIEPFVNDIRDNLLKWQQDFRESLALLNIFRNDTRVNMLLPLLERPWSVSQFRRKINPKIIYENVSMFRAHRLISELQNGAYALTPAGRLALSEYFKFLERIKKLLEDEF